MNFQSPYSHGFLRVAVCIPEVRLADPAHNATRTLDLARRAVQEGAGLVLFPEMGLSAYSNEDLFHQRALLTAVEQAVGTIVEGSRNLAALLVVGAPLAFDDRLFNCAVIVQQGRILGVIPKSYLPNYREFYEQRQFTPGGHGLRSEVELLGGKVPFGSKLLFEAENYPGFVLHAEICEDLWVPLPPSTFAAMAGATVLCNLSASNITIGKASFRRTLVESQSGRAVAAYLYSAAGRGESTTDLAWDGQALIYENGEPIAESERFSVEETCLVADIDLDRLGQDRLRLTSFHDCAAEHRAVLEGFRRIPFTFESPSGVRGLRRPMERFPFVPKDTELKDERCFEAYNIQIHGLEQRLRATGIRQLVIGISGGLDSTQALLVAVKAMDRLGLPRENIRAFTLPGFATSERTYGNAWGLMKALGVQAAEIDIRPSCEQMLKDIDHPFSDGEPVYDVTFENVQAGERTSHLFRLANHYGALVLGTGDLSELALGWNTYGVGDQMSHYNVNASVPKTLIQHLIRWEIGHGHLGGEAEEVLRSILDTEISPELVPGTDDRQPSQSTEERIGPYELQDFHLYFIVRYGFLPSKVAFLAHQAWSHVDRGSWPEGYPEEKRRAYDLPTVKKWLEVFLLRFFKLSQFKRSAMPNAPKVGSGGSLSPRGDWRAPSDSSADTWLEELRSQVP